MNLKKRLLLYPVGGLSIDTLKRSAVYVKESLNGLVEVSIGVQKTNPPLHLMDWKRLQYRADKYVQWLFNKMDILIRGGYLVVSVCECDAYVPGLNFVFGLAVPELGGAAVFTKRLKNSDYETYIRRIAKEITHETGHLLGLNHCKNKECVMSFSNNVMEVDRKSHMFCDECMRKLEKKLNINNE